MNHIKRQAQHAVLTDNTTQFHLYSAKKASVINTKVASVKTVVSIQSLTHTNNPKATSISPPPDHSPTLLTDVDSPTAKMLHR